MFHDADDRWKRDNPDALDLYNYLFALGEFQNRSVKVEPFLNSLREQLRAKGFLTDRQTEALRTRMKQSGFWPAKRN